MTPNECIVCAESPTTLLTVIPDKHTFEECARVQQKGCRECRFTPPEGVPRIFTLPTCGIQCRLIYGSQRIHHLLKPFHKFHKACAEFQISTSQNEPLTDYKIDREAEYECFTCGGFSDTNQNWNGVHVSNVTVNCKTTWVLSWFLHVNITPIFITSPV